MGVTSDISREQQSPWLSGSCNLSALSYDTPTSIFSVLGLQAQALNYITCGAKDLTQLNCRPQQHFKCLIVNLN